jgi:hypothetical protein
VCGHGRRPITWSSFRFSHSCQPDHCFFMRLTATKRRPAYSGRALALRCMADSGVFGGSGPCQSQSSTVPNEPSPTFLIGVYSLMDAGYRRQCLSAGEGARGKGATHSSRRLRRRQGGRPGWRRRGWHRPGHARTWAEPVAGAGPCVRARWEWRQRRRGAGVGHSCAPAAFSRHLRLARACPRAFASPGDRRLGLG